MIIVVASYMKTGKGYMEYEREFVDNPELFSKLFRLRIPLGVLSGLLAVVEGYPDLNRISIPLFQWIERRCGFFDKSH